MYWFMILPDHQIVREMVEGEISIEPCDVPLAKVIKDDEFSPRDAVEESSQIQPSSVDLRFGNEVICFNQNHSKSHIDPFDEGEEYGERIDVEDDGEYILGSGEFILAQTKEYVEVGSTVPDIRATVHGRSSWARVAVQPHLEAGYIDAGYSGNITLEVMNSGPMPIKLVPGRRFCQIEFARLESPAHIGYDGKYQGQRGAEKSRLHEESGEYNE